MTAKRHDVCPWCYDPWSPGALLGKVNALDSPPWHINCFDPIRELLRQNPYKTGVWLLPHNLTRFVNVHTAGNLWLLLGQDLSRKFKEAGYGTVEQVAETVRVPPEPIRELLEGRGYLCHTATFDALASFFDLPPATDAEGDLFDHYIDKRVRLHTTARKYLKNLPIPTPLFQPTEPTLPSPAAAQHWDVVAAAVHDRLTQLGITPTELASRGSQRAGLTEHDVTQLLTGNGHTLTPIKTESVERILGLADGDLLGAAITGHADFTNRPEPRWKQTTRTPAQQPADEYHLPTPNSTPGRPDDQTDQEHPHPVTVTQPGITADEHTTGLELSVNWYPDPQRPGSKELEVTLRLPSELGGVPTNNPCPSWRLPFLSVTRDPDNGKYTARTGGWNISVEASDMQEAIESLPGAVLAHARKLFNVT